MEDLINTNWERLMDDLCHFSRVTGLSNVASDCIDELEPELGPRLKSSEIWVMNDQMDIQV